MMRTAWAAREAQTKQAITAMKRELAQVNIQIDRLMERIVDTPNVRVQRAYEEKIARLDKFRARLTEKAAQTLPPKGRMEDFIEHSLTFLANPWKLWETGQMPLRRVVLKLAFAERPQYHRETGYRTPKTTLPFTALGGVLDNREDMVQHRGQTSNTSALFATLEELETWEALLASDPEARKALAAFEQASVHRAERGQDQISQHRPTPGTKVAP